MKAAGKDENMLDFQHHQFALARTIGSQFLEM